ncbi:MAG: transglutaminase domain-containing protein [Nanoarchaeota archaeon]
MKKGVVFLFVVLLANFAYAENVENYNDISGLNIELALASDLELIPRAAEYEFGYLRAELKYYPAENFMQKLVSKNPFSEPKATVIDQDDYFSYTWRDLRNGKINYGYRAEVKTENKIIPITKRVGFPLRSLEKDAFEYTRPTEFIDINEDIEEKAREIAGSDDDLYRVAFKIAEWIKNNVEYSLTTLTAEAVYPSSWVLENKKGVCDELTNLFISMLRSLGVPARFISGTVYSNTDYKFGNHGWAEVYFPGYGWVPFDVTFGQFGWIDPSHVKLKEDYDSGTSAADYRWAVSGLDVEIGKIEINANVKQASGKISSPLVIEIMPLRDKVGFGSYVPAEVKVKNTEDYYVPAQLFVSKAPGLIGSNYKEILVEPNSEKSVYWILEIPADLQKEFVYTAKIGVNDHFGGYGENSIVYSSNFDGFSRGEAEEFIQRNAERDTKESFSGLKIVCDTDKDYYDEGESAKIICTVVNEKETVSLDVCLLDKCGKLNVQGRGSGSIEFIVEEAYDGRLTVVAEDDSKVVYGNVDMKVLKTPRVKIAGYSPKKANYKEDVNINIVIETNVQLNNVTITAGRNAVFIDKLDGREDFDFKMNSKKLLDGLNVEVVYHDEVGKKHEFEEKLPFGVENLGFWAKVRLFFIRLF